MPCCFSAGQDAQSGPNDIFALAETLPPADLPGLRIDCGVNDFLIDSNYAEDHRPST